MPKKEYIPKCSMRSKHSSYNEMDRDTLEQMALDFVSPTHYYDLADMLQELSDTELINIIECFSTPPPDSSVKTL